MPSVKTTVPGSFGGTSAGGLVRPALEKFASAWLACFLVMARGDILAGFTAEHLLRASVCGAVGAAVAVALLAQMDRSVDTLARQVTISMFVTFIGDTFAHPSHFPPQWAEPTVTAIVSGAIAVALWYARRWGATR